MSIYHSSVITCEHKSAQQELLASIFNSSITACEQCIPRIAQAQHASYLQNFSKHNIYTLHTFFVYLDVSYIVAHYLYYLHTKKFGMYIEYL